MPRRRFIDENGEVTTESSIRTVSINEDKRRRQIAAAATQGDAGSACYFSARFAGT
ncbi:hypothetical protein [Selenomonas sp. FC4001]|uniref:hypothetical protein n=1 Tax=Selenomonas sp. FC4001 TaxID=1408313 RepID=UPI0018CC517B|nr:hypothetical protein [Selenomonas sp. FC4001]